MCSFDLVRLWEDVIIFAYSCSVTILRNLNSEISKMLYTFKHVVLA